MAAWFTFTPLRNIALSGLDQLHRQLGWETGPTPWGVTDRALLNWRGRAWQPLGDTVLRELFVDGRREGSLLTTILVLHCLCGVLVAWLTLRIWTLLLATHHAQVSNTETSRWPGLLATLFAGLWWALHPLRIEALALPHDPALPAGTLLLLLGIVIYLNTACAAQPRVRIAGGLSTLALQGLSIGLTPLAVVWPVVLLTLDGFPLQRLHRRSTWLAKIPFILVAGVAGGLHATHTAQAAAPLVERTAQWANGAVFYLMRTIWPLPLPAIYERPAEFAWSTGLGLAISATVVVLLGAGALARRLPGLFAVVVAYLALLAPTVLLTQSIHERAADRYAYTALIPIMCGLAVLVAWGYTQRHENWRTGAYAGSIIGLLVTAGLPWLTARTLPAWTDERTLWEHIGRTQPRTAIVHLELATLAAARSEFAPAMQSYAAVVQLRPDLPAGHYGRAAMAELLQRYELAADGYAMAAQRDPAPAEAYALRANALAVAGKWEEAAQAAAAAVAAEPDVPTWRALQNRLATLRLEEE